MGLGRARAADHGFRLFVYRRPLGKGMSRARHGGRIGGRSTRRTDALSDLESRCSAIAPRPRLSAAGRDHGSEVCSLGDPSCAIFLDASTARFRKIPIPPTVELGGSIRYRASQASGDYRTRRRDARSRGAARGAPSAEVSVEISTTIEALPEPLKRRARHVVTENARVLEPWQRCKAGREAPALFLIYARARV